MKKIFLLILFCTVASSFVTSAQNVGIGTTTPQAALDVSSTTDGFLPPRFTIDQRNAITNPETGMIIFCTDNGELEMFDGYSWKSMTGSGEFATTSLVYIKICDQVWMQKNLDVIRYRNGDEIPQVTNPDEWLALTTGAWCWYNNDPATYGATYGKLYNWYAVNDPRGLAPAGWHIPSIAEWTTLANCLGGLDVAGGKMKDTGTTHWASPNPGATNSSGFNAVGSGKRVASALFSNFGKDTEFWSSAENNITQGWYFYLYYNHSRMTQYNSAKVNGCSVRCIRD